MLYYKERYPSVSLKNHPYGSLIAKLQEYNPDGHEIKTGFTIHQWNGLLVDDLFCDALLSTYRGDEVFIAKPIDSDEIWLNLGTDDMCGPRRRTDIDLGHTHTFYYESYIQGIGRGIFTPSSGDYDTPNTFKGDPARRHNNQRVVISSYGRFYHSPCMKEDGVGILEKALPNSFYKKFHVSFDAALRSIAPYDFPNYKECIEALLGCSVRFMPTYKFAVWMEENEKKDLLFEKFAELGYDTSDFSKFNRTRVERLIELVKPDLN